MRSEDMARRRAIKKALVEQMKLEGVDPREVSEWLWEDFGKRVPPSWARLERAILSERTITPQDVAVFMIEQGLQPEEGAWDVQPVRGVRGRREDPGGSGGP